MKFKALAGTGTVMDKVALDTQFVPPITGFINDIQQHTLWNLKTNLHDPNLHLLVQAIFLGKKGVPQQSSYKVGFRDVLG